MYIEKRHSKDKTLYYLGHSFRDGKKVKKIRKYLGADLSPATLAEREQIARRLVLDEIRQHKTINDPLRDALSLGEIELVKRIEKNIPDSLRHFSEQDWMAFASLFTYNTNAIEGSDLTSKDVKAILQHDTWPDKSKNDIAEAYGVNDAIKHIRNTTEHLSLDLIKHLHHTVFRNSKPFAGHVRKKGEEVVVMGPEGIVHSGAPQDRVVSLLNELIHWYNTHQDYPGLLLAAVVHNQFEHIHPFRDGNGRVGRLLLNHILIKHGLPPVNIDYTNRNEYYQSLRDYDTTHDIKPSLSLFIKEYRTVKRRLRNT